MSSVSIMARHRSIRIAIRHDIHVINFYIHSSLSILNVISVLVLLVQKLLWKKMLLLGRVVV